LKAQQAGAFFRVLFSFKELLGSTAFFIKEKPRNKILKETATRICFVT